MDFAEYSTWIEIDRGAIANNVSLLTKITGKPVMAVVKANGYGHGLVESARAARAGGAAWCGVARIEEAMMLREGRLDLPLLVLGYTPSRKVIDAARENLSLTLYDPDIARDYSAAASGAGMTVRVHIKVDVGMGRLGIFPEEVLEFVRFVNDLPGLMVEGIFTHFPTADEPALEYTGTQISRFQKVVQTLELAGLRPPLIHAANSAAALLFPESRFGLVRSGVAVYGLHPSNQALLPEGFSPALSLKSRIVSIKTIPPGQGISYNYRYFTSGYERIGVCSAGYADGIRRRLGNVALVEGKRVHVVGAVCMDQSMVQLDDVPEARIGSEVVWIGRQGNEQISAEDVAREWGTVNYEVVTGLDARVPRIYIGG
jgi:alanine racemase